MKLLRYSCALLLLLLGVSRLAGAQPIPNSGLETWATRGTAEAPSNWLTWDDILAANDPGYTYNTGTTTKSTDAHGGLYAAKLTNIAFSNSSGSTVLNGELILGTKLGTQAFFNGYPVGGIAFPARPVQLQFYYKLTGPTTDQATATLLLTKTSATGGLPTIVGGGIVTLTPTTGSYTAITATIPYSSTVTPDSVRILFNSASTTTPTAGSVLLIDDVALLGGVLAVRADASLQELLTVAPNPSANGHFQITSPALPGLASSPYTVLDLAGRVVAQQPALAVANSTRELDLSRLSTGIYLLRIESKQGILTRQLVVK